MYTADVVDPDGPSPLSFTYQWRRSDPPAGPSTVIPGAQEATYIPVGASAAGGVDALFADNAPAALAANPGSGSGAGGGLDAHRFEAKFGYSLGAGGDRSFELRPRRDPHGGRQRQRAGAQRRGSR